MCFSAGASFGASAVLAVTGVASIKRASSSSEYMFAGIPMLFAFQQFAEGILWLSLTNADYAGWENAATNTFLLIALVIWPIWVPSAMLFIEKKSLNKKILSACFIIGIITSAFMFHTLITSVGPAKINGNHILYDVRYPINITLISSLMYVIPTAGAHFISSIKSVRILGLVISLSYIITKILYTQYVISIWCFFAAIISMMILRIMIQFSKGEEKDMESYFRHS